MNSSGSVTRTFALSFLATLTLVGCAQNPDIRSGHDYAGGTTERNPGDYIKCVQSELQRNPKAYTQQEGGALKLFIEGNDPNTAEGLVEVTGSGQQHQYSAYQRDAWYDRGELLDAARMCSYG